MYKDCCRDYSTSVLLLACSCAVSTFQGMWGYFNVEDSVCPPMVVMNDHWPHAHCIYYSLEYTHTSHNRRLHSTTSISAKINYFAEMQLCSALSWCYHAKQQTVDHYL